jgi:hypothetical protein
MKACFAAQILRHPQLDWRSRRSALLLVIEFPAAGRCRAFLALLLAALLIGPLRLLAAASRFPAHRHRHHVPRLPRHRRCQLLIVAFEPLAQFRLGRQRLHPPVHLRRHGR